MRSSTTIRKKHGLRMLILVVGACLAILTAGTSVNAAPCIDLSDIPLDALEQAAPGLILFVLDDSGSMDWSMMTAPGLESGGVFNNYEYIYKNPGDDLFTGNPYDDNLEDSAADRMMWKSQWSGYNRMYYNPETEYTPWPTMSDVDPDNPPSNPNNAGNTLDMTAVWHPMDADVLVDNDDAGFSTTGIWNVYNSGSQYGVNFSLNYDDGDYLDDADVGALNPFTATWWSDNLRPNTPYEVFTYRPWNNCTYLLPSVDYKTYDIVSGNRTEIDSYSLDQCAANLGEWVKIASNVTFQDGEGEVEIDVPLANDYDINADAVKFVLTTPVNDVMRRHYYVSNASGTYLVNMFNGTIEYYRVNLDDFTDNHEVVTAGKLVPITSADATAAGIVTGRTYAEEIQNFANWYSFYRRRELTAKNAVAKAISGMNGVYVGIISINGNIAQRVRPVRVTLDGVLYDESATLISALYNLDSNGGTPLRNGLKNAGEYFKGNYLKPSTFISQTSSATYPFFKADKGGTCQQAFTILFTDGYYNGGDPGVGDADDDNNTDFDGPPFAGDADDSLADVAMHYFETDLQTGLADDVPVTAVDPADHQHMVTFTIAFGVNGTLDPTLYPDCPTGACPTWSDNIDTDSERIDDMYHAAINGRGQFIAAANNEELVAALEALGKDIDSRLGSAAALATNSIQRQVGSVIYQGTYNTANWYGEVSALPLNLATGNVGTPVWQASDHIPAWGSRNILSYNGTIGIPFDDASMTTAQVAQLETGGLGTAAEIVNYIKGDNTNTVDNGGTLRNRNKPLGDVVHSAPIYFEGMVYIGANDGMLHGLDAVTGEELFAYVPNLVYDHLYELADPGYSHKYYVDGTATVARVGARDVLVCGLGKGGKGYFALDVADPTAMDSTDVLWEYTAAGDDDLGYTFSRAFIVNTEAAGKVMVFGNGYDSVNGFAVLYVLDPTTGAVLKKFNTQVGGCNALATPAPVDVQLDGYVDYVFAGDLKGNMWKFDLRGASTSDWAFGYQNGTSPQPLVSVRNAAGDIQPITSQPEVMLDCVTAGDVRGLMVIFGTGQYLNTDDFINVPEQSYYGIWDRGPLFEDSDGLSVSRTKYLGTFEADRSLSNMATGVTLLEQVFEIQGVEWWALTDYQPDWYDEASGTGTHMGWFWNMPVTGERNIREPLLRGGNAVLISTIPSDSPCDSGGISYINYVNACTGGRPTSPQFDVNGDGLIDDNDKIPGPPGSPEPKPPSRKKEPKILFDALEVGDKLYLPDSEGGIGGMDVIPIRSGMFYWRVIGQ